MPKSSDLSTLPYDNVRLRQKIVPSASVSRNTVYKICWKDLVKKKHPARHFTETQCKGGWECKVVGDTCGGIPEKPKYTCVNQLNPGLCSNPPCWFGNDGYREKDGLNSATIGNLETDRANQAETSAIGGTEKKLGRCPDGWNYIGDGRCEASEDNRGTCEGILTLSELKNDAQKKSWSRKCSVKWTGKVPLKSSAPAASKFRPEEKMTNEVADLPGESAIFYQNKDFKGKKLMLPMIGSHCADMVKQNPSILWNFIKDNRICENENGERFGEKVKSVKLHPDYQMTAWNMVGFKKGSSGIYPVTITESSPDVNVEIGKIKSYVVCRKSEANKKGHCSKPGY